MSDDKEPSEECVRCRWWRYQSGSSHVLCAKRPDFSFSWGRPPCELFAAALAKEASDAG